METKSPMSMKCLRGFTLIEVLAALALFALALLGVALFTGKAIKIGLDDNVRGIALYTANQYIEPLKVAASNGYPALRTALLAFDTDGSSNQTVSREVKANNGKDTFILAITAAQDRNGLNILTNASPNLWRAPVTMSVTITNKDATNVAARATYTLLDYN